MCVCVCELVDKIIKRKGSNTAYKVIGYTFFLCEGHWVNVMQHNCISFCKCKCMHARTCCMNAVIVILYTSRRLLVILAFLCVFMVYVYMYIPSKESPF